MAEQAPSGSRPVRGILKNPSSAPKPVTMESEGSGGGIRWDEINIMMTEHPEGKDYGHMKINEPKTPYHERMSGDEEDEESSHDLSADTLAAKVLQARTSLQTGHWGERESSGSSDDDEELSEEVKEHKKKFKEWRKKHYNEYQAVQRARALIQQEEEEREGDGEAEREGGENPEQSEQMQF